LPSADAALQKKLTALKRHVERIEAIADFLTRNPKVAERTTLKRMSTGTGLYFEEKGYIRPVATGPVYLQLEKHMEDWSIEDSTSRIICKDVRLFSSEQLNDVLKKIGVDLNKPDDDKDEDDAESGYDNVTQRGINWNNPESYAHV
jgi:hypothetical protein